MPFFQETFGLGSLVSHRIQGRCNFVFSIMTVHDMSFPDQCLQSIRSLLAPHGKFAMFERNCFEKLSENMKCNLRLFSIVTFFLVSSLLFSSPSILVRSFPFSCFSLLLFFFSPPSFCSTLLFYFPSILPSPFFSSLWSSFVLPFTASKF